MSNFLENALHNPIPSLKGFIIGGPIVAGIEVSVKMNEQHTISSEVTNLTMEEGTKVSDHIIRTPDSVSVTFEVSNRGLAAMFRGVRAKDVFEKFREMINKRELITLLTEHYKYENMAVISINPSHDAPFKGRLRATLTLRQVNKVKLTLVGRESTKTKAKSAAAQQSGGEQAPKPAGPGFFEAVTGAIGRGWTKLTNLFTGGSGG